MSIVPKSPSEPPSSPSSEVLTPRRERRSFSPVEKLRIVREADACTERGQIEALCRREGIYSSHLASWRKALALHGELGLGSRKRGRKPSRDAKDVRIEALEKRAARLERDLDVARKVIDVQKKISEILGIQLPPLPDEEQ